MSGSDRLIERVSRFVHEHFLGLLLATYAVAAVWPELGVALRGVSLGRASLGAEGMAISLPALMLGFLLLNAGLGVKAGELRGLAGRPALIGAGLAANVLIPVGFVFVVSRGLQGWHNAGEVQMILVGLAMVATMPIAGSSTAWAQNADGDLALSLGLVVGSTLISPVVTPLALHAIGFMAEGDSARDLHGLAAHGTGLFLVLCVVGPSLAGIGLRSILGERRVARLRPGLKLANSANLLLLSYCNAAIALPQAVARPDWDFLLAILAVTSALCVLGFATGWGIGRAAGAPASARASLMYGLGMSNNGTGLVLASMVLGNRPGALLPIIFYNLVQQVVAGAVGDLESRRGRLAEARPAIDAPPPGGMVRIGEASP